MPAGAGINCAVGQPLCFGCRKQTRASHALSMPTRASRTSGQARVQAAPTAGVGPQSAPQRSAPPTLPAPGPAYMVACSPTPAAPDAQCAGGPPQLSRQAVRSSSMRGQLHSGRGASQQRRCSAPCAAVPLQAACRMGGCTQQTLGAARLLGHGHIERLQLIQHWHARVGAVVHPVLQIQQDAALRGHTKACMSCMHNIGARHGLLGLKPGLKPGSRAAVRPRPLPPRPQAPGRDAPGRSAAAAPQAAQGSLALPSASAAAAAQMAARATPPQRPQRRRSPYRLLGTACRAAAPARRPPQHPRRCRLAAGRPQRCCPAVPRRCCHCLCRSHHWRRCRWRLLLPDRGWRAGRWAQTADQPAHEPTAALRPQAAAPLPDHPPLPCPAQWQCSDMRGGGEQ